MSQDHNQLNHGTSKCKYHVVFTPKYHKKLLFDRVDRSGVMRSRDNDNGGLTCYGRWIVVDPKPRLGCSGLHGQRICGREIVQHANLGPRPRIICITVRPRY
jgi:hypothetical protein